MGQRAYYDDKMSPQLVPEGDPTAAFLAAGEADPIPDGFKAPKGTKASGKDEDK